MCTTMGLILGSRRDDKDEGDEGDEGEGFRNSGSCWVFLRSLSSDLRWR